MIGITVNTVAITKDKSLIERFKKATFVYKGPHTWEYRSFHMGTVSIAQITGAPIYPFAVNKDYKLFNNSLCVAIGDPIYVKPNDNLEEKNEELKEAISELLKKVENYEEQKEASKR